MVGKIIAIEGNDGVGKETQSKLLVETLNNIGIKTELLSFPNYNSDSSSIVKMYLNGELGSINDITIDQHAMIFALDRFATIKKNNIKEKLNNGTWFVIDRYILSNIIYGLAKASNLSDITPTCKKILSIESSLGNPAPNINFILKLSSEFSNKLRMNRANKINNSDIKDIHESNNEYLEKVNSAINIISDIEKMEYTPYGEFFNTMINIPIECDNGVEILSKEEIHSMIMKKLIENGVK